MKKIFFLKLLIALIAVGCAKEKSSWLVNPPPEDHSFKETAGELTFELQPRAEILFVIDNSASMNQHIQNVSKNIDSFVEAFSVNNPLEYTLAVTAVYDSRTFDSSTYKEKWGQKSLGLEPGIFRAAGTTNDLVAQGGDNLVIHSQDANLVEKLRNNLKIGIEKLEDGGPQYEELFSPVAAIYNLSGLKLSKEREEKQSAFFNGDDSYKIIFFVTDSTDASYISPSELYYGLKAKAGGDANKVMAFAAIIPSGKANCKRDSGGKPTKIEDFLELTKSGDEKSSRIANSNADKNSNADENSNIVSLCDSFGSKFSDFGKSIRRRTLRRNFPLKNAVPVINNNPEETLRVFYGRQEIPFETRAGIVGFRYNPEKNSVWLNPEFQFANQPGAKLCMQYTAVSATGLATGRGEKHTCKN